jgi:hypothetical protein
MTLGVRYSGFIAILLLAACGGDAPPQAPVATAPAPATVAPVAAPAVDPGSALIEARRCGRALAVAARCNYVRDDRDFAALRYTVLQGLDRRYASVVDTARMTEAVDLAVLDRMGTIGSCDVPPADIPVVESGLREVLSSCAAR